MRGILLTAFLISLLSQIVFAADGFPAAANTETGSYVIPFSAPENSYAALHEFVSGAKSELKVAAYKFTSYDIAKLFLAARERGVNVTVMIEKSPVGSFPEQTKIIACAFQNKIPVYSYDQPLRFMHAKYIVRDETETLISSENLGKDGYPTNETGNRGWGAVVFGENVATTLSEIFDNDVRNQPLLNCERKYENETLYGNIPEPKTEGLKKYAGQNVSLVIAPDNAVEKILQLIGGAQNFLDIQQFYIYPYWGTLKKQKENLFLEAAIDKAKEGVPVRILLDGSFYSVEEDDPSSNYNTAQYVRQFSQYPIDVRIADPKSLRVSKTHNKALISGSKVLVSSINWNENSPTRNREVGVIVEGAASSYYRALFESDWNLEPVAAAGSYVTGRATSPAAAEGFDMWWLAVFSVIGIAAVAAFAIKMKAKHEDVKSL